MKDVCASSILGDENLFFSSQHAHYYISYAAKTSLPLLSEGAPLPASLAFSTTMPNASEKPAPPNRWLFIQRSLKTFLRKFRKQIAEFLATYIFMTVGLCGSLSHLAGSVQPGFFDSSSSFAANNAWAFGLLIAICLAGRVSGAHLNPVVTFILTVFRDFHYWDCWQYIIAQVLGSFLASLTVMGLHRDTLNVAALRGLDTNSSFTTAPRPGLNHYAAFFNEFLATAILIAFVLAMEDSNHKSPEDEHKDDCLGSERGVKSLIMVFSIIGLELAFSYNTGTCLNPARDVGPRLAIAVSSINGHPFYANDRWWAWGSWLGPFSGGLVGAILYDTFLADKGQ